ncbi:hypothetical protein [Lysinibacillus sp. FSL K6-0102]|uniref:hypothetical protein n=1 Tax=Lysinibacillus sp. FSL K6-0102 TaxID=2975290 RepID=UPI0030FBB039
MSTDINAMVAEFLRLEALENELADHDELDKAQIVNDKKWKVKKMARSYNVEKEFSEALKSARK